MPKNLQEHLKKMIILSLSIMLVEPALLDGSFVPFDNIFKDPDVQDLDL